MDRCALTIYPYSLGTLPLSSWDKYKAQKLIDHFEENRGPADANHMGRVCRRVFNWACSRGHAQSNPFTKFELAEERKKRTLPTDNAYDKILEFSKTTSCKYLWITMELAYLCRMRGIEVLDLTDDNEDIDGLLIKRRKNSRNTKVKWNPRLLKAWNAAKELRKEMVENNGLSLPEKASDSFIIYGSTGKPLARSSLSTAWQRVITEAIKIGIIDKSERFSMHDLKRKGVTDTKGNRADKQQASGHRSANMMDIYDLEEVTVEPVSE